MVRNRLFKLVPCTFCKTPVITAGSRLEPVCKNCMDAIVIPAQQIEYANAYSELRMLGFTEEELTEYRLTNRSLSFLKTIIELERLHRTRIT